jgi:hypothetical protein
MNRSTLYRRRRVKVGIGLAVLGVVITVSVSLLSALTNPALGSSLGSRLAEWARGHGASGIVNWAENQWYSHHPPQVGGKPPAGAFRRPVSFAKTSTTATPHLPAPAPVLSPATPALPGEGQWSPAGRLVDGIPAIYTTTVRPDSIHTSYVAGIAWMDTDLLKATLYSGSQIPGGGPYSHSAPIAPSAASTLAAAFNAGFLLPQSDGGYYTDGRTIAPLRTGAASFVIYRNGTSTVGEWGRDVTMTANVVAVRQNLDLLVDGGRPATGLNAYDTTKWGNTLGNRVYVWRSGLGVTADGALVYVGGPALNVTDLADLLIRAGAIRAMELDINTDWVNLTTYAPTGSMAASPANGAELLPQMTGGPGRYFETWWARDFITMSAKAN